MGGYEPQSGLAESTKYKFGRFFFYFSRNSILALKKNRVKSKKKIFGITLKVVNFQLFSYS